MTQDSVKNLEHLIDFLDQDTNKKLVKVHDLPPIREWIESRYYLGNDIDDLYPYWKNVIIEFFESGKNELILSGSTGCGKSYVADIINLRLLHELYSYNDPSKVVGLASNSTLAMVYLSVTLSQAQETGFGRFKKMVDNNPFCNEFAQRNKRKNKQLVFPNEAVKVFAGSNEGHFIGMNLFALVFDEANFVSTQSKNDLSKFEKAINIYREASNRKKNRFMKDGKESGVRVLISSANYQNSFVETRMRELKDDDNVMIVNARKFEVKPEDFSNKRFWIFLGNQYEHPFVINKDNEEKYNDFLQRQSFPKTILPNDYTTIEIPETVKDKFISIPIDYYESFRLDVRNSLKEVGGVSIVKTDTFFSDIEKYNNCIDLNMKHPFYKESFEVSTADTSNVLKNMLEIDFKGKKGINYYLAIDISYTKDSCGIGLGHMSDGIAFIDFMLEIKAPKKPEKISFKAVQDFIEYLYLEREVNIIKFIGDGYQTESMIQFFSRYGIDCYTYSVEKATPYEFLANKIVANEVRFYDYPKFRFELFNLVYGTKDTINHIQRKGYSKDITDIVCRLVNNLFLYEPIVKKRKSKVNFYSLFNQNGVLAGIDKRAVLKAEERNGFVIDKKSKLF